MVMKELGGISNRKRQQDKYDRFRDVEFENLDVIVESVLDRCPKEHQKPDPARYLCASPRYAQKLWKSERTRRKLWSLLSGGRFGTSQVFFSHDDAAFEKMQTGISAVTRIYLCAIDMSDEDSLIFPPSCGNEKAMRKWIKELRHNTGVDWMLKAFFDEGVPLEDVVATSD